MHFANNLTIKLLYNSISKCKDDFDIEKATLKSKYIKIII